MFLVIFQPVVCGAARGYSLSRERKEGGTVRAVTSGLPSLGDFFIGYPQSWGLAPAVYPGACPRDYGTKCQPPCEHDLYG